jgi:3-oxoacyl-[acyl-carrier protein] reductase
VVADSIDEIVRTKSVSRDIAAADLMENVYHMPVALRRPGRAREVGELMAFLLSERATYMTGAVINIDGGTDF